MNDLDILITIFEFCIKSFQFCLKIITYPASPTSLVKHLGSSGKQALQYSPDSVQSSTLKDATRLFLVAVTLYHLPVSTLLLVKLSLVMAVLEPPHDNLGCPSTNSTLRKSDLPPADFPKLYTNKEFGLEVAKITEISLVFASKGGKVAKLSSSKPNVECSQ